MTAAFALVAMLSLCLSAAPTDPPVPRADWLSPRASAPAADTLPPDMMLGVFEDDYGDRHTISAAEWSQHPRNRFHIVRWNIDAHYLVARNDSTNAGPPGRWTRIDWVPLTGMPPYAWAFCFSSFEARSAAEAESVRVARPETPRTGCNGFPFSRMKRVP